MEGVFVVYRFWGTDQNAISSNNSMLCSDKLRVKGLGVWGF